MAGIPDFNTEELEALLRVLRTLYDSDANQATVMTMEEAIEVGKHLYITYYMI